MISSDPESGTKQSEHDRRGTAFDWHGGEMSPLYAYAETGSILPQLGREIHECLTAIDQGAITWDTDPDVERQRLLALLRHVELDVAVCEAQSIGREHGGSAADWWRQDALGGLSIAGRGRTADWVMRGMDGGDPAALDELPGLDPDYGQSELEDDCAWEQPLGDPGAHERWAAGRDRLWAAYESEFNDTLTRTVADHCRTAVVDAHLARIGARRVDSAVLELTPPEAHLGIMRLEAFQREDAPGAGLGDLGAGL